MARDSYTYWGVNPQRPRRTPGNHASGRAKQITRPLVTNAVVAGEVLVVQPDRVPDPLELLLG